MLTLEGSRQVIWVTVQLLGTSFKLIEVYNHEVLFNKMFVSIYNFHTIWN
jgi:hypothetical protein